MNKLISYCDERKILLTKEQRNTEIKFNIRNIYSVYCTHLGLMFFINTNKGNFFLHLYNAGGFKTEDGYDGGDLLKYYNEVGHD